MKLRIPYLLATFVAIASCLYLADTRSLKAAPLVNIHTISGESIDLALPDGKTRLITFWAPDCPISERNIPSVKWLQEHFAHEAFEVVAIAMPYSKPAQINSYVEKHAISYPVAHDSNSEMADAFPGVRFTPTTFLIDGDGNIIWKHIGRMKGSAAKAQIADALQPQQLAKR